MRERAAALVLVMMAGCVGPPGEALLGTYDGHLACTDDATGEATADEPASVRIERGFGLVAHGLGPCNVPAEATSETTAKLLPASCNVDSGYWRLDSGSLVLSEPDELTARFIVGPSRCRFDGARRAR